MSLPTIDSLDELAAIVEGSTSLYVRWSEGPDRDLERHQSRDELTDAGLPGLSANSMAVEDWWGERPLRLWVARRLYDYRHLQQRRPGIVRPWLLEGEEVGRGPDNEPLVRCRRPMAWIAEDLIAESEELVRQSSESWGPLEREADSLS